MTEEVLKILLSKGWNADRKIYIKEELDLLFLNGYEVTNRVEKIIEQFEGIHFWFYKKNINYYRNEEFQIEIKDAIVRCDFKMATTYSKMCGEKLVPIGSTCCGRMSILASPTGVLYTETDGILLKHGNSFEESLNSLLVVDCCESIGSEELYYSMLEELYDN